MEQKEFHDVVTIGEARRRLRSSFTFAPRVEVVGLDEALGRVTAGDVAAPIDVPPFDRATMDGYAVQATETFHADEERPRELALKGQIMAGEARTLDIGKGGAIAIATGAPLPKGANAVVMVEYTHKKGRKIRIYKPVTPGENVMAAGSDIMRGETVVRRGTIITPRETGVLAALGLGEVEVFVRPSVGIISTGDEIVGPGKKLEFGQIYDVNGRAIAHAVRENGCNAEFLGVVKDDPKALLKKLREMVERYDLVITSGGTSAGLGDLAYRIIDDLGRPGVIVHGVAIKPGKPTVIGVVGNKPIIGLPGYPTSAMVVFDVLVAPLLRAMARLPGVERKKVQARAAMRLYSAKGRYEYILVNLVQGADGGLGAYPILTGSGAITTLAEADGYIEVPELMELVPEGSDVEVTLLSEGLRPTDLTIIGSHCLGVDLLLALMNVERPTLAKVINVGSSGGMMAVRRGEADIAGTHLIDDATGEYNLPFLARLKVARGAYLVRGYDREQGLMAAKGNPRGIKGIEDLLRPDVTLINRNAGSGTRILLDMELKRLARERSEGIKDLVQDIKGYQVEAKSHTAVAASVAFGRADVGLAIRTVAEQYGLTFIPLREEKYDFAIPADRIDKPAVRRFLGALRSDAFKEQLAKMPGLRPNEETGKVVHEPGRPLGKNKKNR